MSSLSSSHVLPFLARICAPMPLHHKIISPFETPFAKLLLTYHWLYAQRLRRKMTWLTLYRKLHSSYDITTHSFYRRLGNVPFSWRSGPSAARAGQRDDADSDGEGTVAAGATWLQNLWGGRQEVLQRPTGQSGIAKWRVVKKMRKRLHGHGIRYYFTTFAQMKS